MMRALPDTSPEIITTHDLPQRVHAAKGNSRIRHSRGASITTIATKLAGCVSLLLALLEVNIALRSEQDGYPGALSKATRLRGATTPEATRQPRRAETGGSAIGDSAVPEQIKIALADPRPRQAYAMSVSWLTWEDAESRVFWGSQGDSLDSVVTGNSTSYTTHHVDLNLTEYTSGKLHWATIEGLEPSSTFYYACGDEERGLSSVREFTTPSAVGPSQAVTFGVLGDLGQTNDSRNTVEAISRHQPAIDVVLHAGDLSYADCHEELWDSFLQMLDPVSSRIPWMVAAGNHEIEAGSIKGGVFNAYEHRFRMPEAGPAVRGLHCGVGGGLDGNETACGPGLHDLMALQAATNASDAGLGGEGVAAAALRAREAIIPFGGVVTTTGWPKKKDRGGEEGEVDEQSMQQCAPSEWAGTYDFGNRWAKSY